MTRHRLAGLLRHRPRGLVEIYLHPATDDGFEGSAPGYRYREELAALCDPVCRDLAAGLSCDGYADAHGAEPGWSRVSIPVPGCARLT